MRYCFILLLAIVLLAFQGAQSTTIELPVSQKTLTKVNLSIKYLEDSLKHFGTNLENRFLIYKRVELTKSYLQDLREELARYNNVIAGSANSVNGNRNIVIGNYNTVEGSNNWIFVSKFTGKINGDLLIGQWRIQLDKSNLILTNPRFAISFLDESRNRSLRQNYASQNRQLCRWDRWTRPDNLKANEFWKNYQGYAQWRNNFLSGGLNLIGNILGGVTRQAGGILGGLFRRR